MSDNTSERRKFEKLDSYTIETIGRAQANYYIEIGKQLGDQKFDVDNAVREIAHNWNSDDGINTLRTGFSKLSEIAGEQGDEISRLGIEENLASLPTDFRDSLRKGGLLGQLVGAQLLKIAGIEGKYTDDPILTIGANFVIDFLKDEQDDRQVGGDDPLKLAEGSKHVIGELTKFKEISQRTKVVA